MRSNLLEICPSITKPYGRAGTRLSLLLTQIRPIQNLAVIENEMLFVLTPHDNQVSTNIGKAFFHFLRQHFPLSHRLCKICNKYNIKLSYICTPNMGNIIAAQNKKLIYQHDSLPKPQPCNCRNTKSCPFYR